MSALTRARSAVCGGWGLGALLLLAGCGPRESWPAPPDPTTLVDPFIGSGGGGFAQPQVFVGPTVPFGMVKPGPDTTGPYLGRAGFAHTAGYWHLDDTIEGFSQLHLHGVGVEDYGNILLMPTDGMDATKVRESGYQQGFDHADETARPGYYAVSLESGVRVELTASAHAAVHRYTWPGETGEPTVLVDVGHALGAQGPLATEVSIDPVTGEVSGSMENAARFTGPSRSFPVFFSLLPDFVPGGHGVWADLELRDGETAASAPRTGAWLTLPPGARQATVRIGVSVIDLETARRNRTSVDALTFEAVQADATDRWREALSVVDVWGGTDAERRAFYTALYHSMMMPTLWTESDGRYRGLDREVHLADGFDYHTDFSLWDTYRTLHPLLMLLAPERARHLGESLLAMADQHGALPRWPLAVNETGTMIGSPGAIVLVESVLKGIVLDEERVWDVVLADADLVPGRTIRGDFAVCLEVGFCPADRMGGSVSKAQEFGWADFAIANLATARGDADEAGRMRERARMFTRHWDVETGFFRGRNEDGSWADEPLDPEAWTESYTEGNAWQYLFAAPYDPAALIEVFGSRDALLDRLEVFFDLSEATPTPVLGAEPFMAPDLYYWHGNEPDLHVPWLYALLGEPGRGASRVEWVRAEKYDDTPDGLAGNDDAGTLSAWYVFSALGLYPLAGSDVYLLGPPLFERALLRLPGGDLEIRAEGLAPGAVVQEATFEGERLTSPYLSHAALAGGGRLHLQLGPAPSSWGRTAPWQPGD